MLGLLRVAVPIFAGVLGGIWCFSAAIHIYGDFLHSAGWPYHDPWWGYAGFITTTIVSVVGGGGIVGGIVACFTRPWLYLSE